MALFTALLTALTVPKPELWPHWDAHNDRFKVAIDHATWNAFLALYVRKSEDGINRVAYSEVTPEDRARLDGYVRLMQTVPIGRFARKEQLAYWINLYNAETVKLVLDHYPVSSILKIAISPGWFDRGPWDAKLLKIEGEELSLNDIEHRILRPIWRDSRIHYALNCASLGCPNLQPQAFTGGNTEAMLDNAAREYVNHPRGAHFEDGHLIVSSIYNWYKSDFGGSDATVLAHLRRYAEPKLARRLGGVSEISDYQYDWALNDFKQ